MIRLKRVYEPSEPTDGERLLVERLWPRGQTKAEAKIDRWLKDLAPSTELRRWYAHDVKKWAEFRRRYEAELKLHASMVDELRKEAKRHTLTFVFAAKDTEHNSAVVLREVIEGSKAGS